MEKKLQEKASLLDRFLDTVERVCNKLPPPAILFGILFVITAIVGALHPGRICTGKPGLSQTGGIPELLY